MDTFYDKQSTQEMIIGAGEVIALKMFNIESSSSTSLSSGKTAKAATIAKAVSLPPTSYAPAQHSLRCYHQIQCWLGHTEYGYCVKTACLGKSSFARDYEEPCCTRCLIRLPKLWLLGACNTKKSSCYNASKINVCERLSASI